MREYKRLTTKCEVGIMEGFAITQDGMLILIDECGRYTYCPDNRFKVVAESELKINSVGECGYTTELS